MHKYTVVPRNCKYYSQNATHRGSGALRPAAGGPCVKGAVCRAWSVAAARRCQSAVAGRRAAADSAYLDSAWLGAARQVESSMQGWSGVRGRRSERRSRAGANRRDERSA
ncbi:hypothetical protein SETIT_9G164700v2 [Setaria italica]|uniref:Uncharacterized protein n=1 Tax=Setaria italica TaxID=4555 RepID=A0A368SJ29_SETIT|nr:hypothetical protein SETIT_9G164700v2 [Setaria italica]